MKMFTLDEIEAMPIADGDKLKIAFRVGKSLGMISAFAEVINDLEDKKLKEAGKDLFSKNLA